MNATEIKRRLVEAVSAALDRIGNDSLLPNGIGIPAGIGRIRTCKGIQLKFAAAIHAIGREQAAFPGNKADGCVGLERNTGCKSRIGIKAGRNVQRQPPASGLLHALDEQRIDARRRPADAGSEQTIHDDICRRQHGIDLGESNASTGIAPTSPRSFGIAARLLRTGHELDSKALGFGQDCNQERIAPVVAGSSHDGESSCLGPALAQAGECRKRRPGAIPKRGFVDLDQMPRGHSAPFCALHTEGRP